MKETSIAILKKGSILTLTVEDLAFGGKGIAKWQNLIIFVNRTLPGQTVKAQIFKLKKNYAEAKAIEIVEESPHAVVAPCPHFGICGGCLFQNMDYQQQLHYKRKQVTETLQHIGGFSEIKVNDTLPSPDIYFYRNKMEFSFSDKRWLTLAEMASTPHIEDKNFALGLHVPGRFDKVLDIERCELLSETSNRILGEVKLWAKQQQLPPYSTADHSGFLRFLVIREGKQTAQKMINLVTADGPQFNETVDQLQQKLCAMFPEIITFVHTINRKKAQIATGEVERILHGPGFILETLGGYTYRLSANSFFQTNTRQAEHLYNHVLEWGQFSPNDVVYDLYSGTGSIAVYIAQHVQRVIGFELIPQAIEDANQNCSLNKIENCAFVLGDLKEQLSSPQSLVHRFNKPDTIIIDPPRSGMHPDIPAKIIELAPRKIIYVSCNPATLARDLAILCEPQYALQAVQPVDMFPHTAHCEVVVLLERKCQQATIKNY